MFIAVSKDTKRVHMVDSEVIYQEETGYPVFPNLNIAFPLESVSIFEVETLPYDLDNTLYCYTIEEGFYEDLTWEKPNKYGISEEIYKQIQDDTIADLIELGVL